MLCGEWIWPSDKSPEKLRDGIRHLFNELRDENWSFKREKSRNSFSASIIRQTGPWLLDKWNVFRRKVWQEKFFWDPPRLTRHFFNGFFFAIFKLKTMTCLVLFTLHPHLVLRRKIYLVLFKFNFFMFLDDFYVKNIFLK